MWGSPIISDPARLFPLKVGQPLNRLCRCVLSLEPAHFLKRAILIGEAVALNRQPSAQLAQLHRLRPQAPLTRQECAA